MIFLKRDNVVSYNNENLTLAMAILVKIIGENGNESALSLRKRIFEAMREQPWSYGIGLYLGSMTFALMV